MNEETQVVAINYWKSVNKEFKRLMMEFWNSLLLIHNSVEIEQIANFIKKLPYSGKIVYISLTKTNDSIYPYFEDMKMKTYVVDCISSSLFKKEDTEKCFFESTPSNYNELSGLIDKYLKKEEPGFIILDSLSQFYDFTSTSFSESQEFHKFMDYLKSKNHTPCRFIMLYDNNLSESIPNLPTLSIDVIVKLEIMMGRVYWGDW